MNTFYVSILYSNIINIFQHNCILYYLLKINTSICIYIYVHINIIHLYDNIFNNKL